MPSKLTTLISDLQDRVAKRFPNLPVYRESELYVDSSGVEVSKGKNPETGQFDVHYTNEGMVYKKIKGQGEISALVPVERGRGCVKRCRQEYKYHPLDGFGYYGTDRVLVPEVKDFSALRQEQVWTPKSKLADYLFDGKGLYSYNEIMKLQKGLSGLDSGFTQELQ